MKAITFSLETLQPLLATSFQGDPNSDVSYSYIPGSLIRGAIIGRYMKEKRIRDLDDAPDQTEVKRLFFTANSTRYLNAYLQSQKDLQSQKEERTLPMPQSWFKDKNSELSEAKKDTMLIYDRATEDELPEEIEAKRVEQQFCTVQGNSVVIYSESRRINIHNWRDRKKGRSTKEQGDIFRYEALDVGQTFQGVILCNEEDEVTLRQLLEQSEDIWLGGSQSAGYGHTKISFDKDKVNFTWGEVKELLECRAKHNGLIITLLSDTLLRDENGQPVADPKLVKQAIENVLNITLPELKQGGIFASNTHVGGFNRKWGLPLPQLSALAAGSVIVFDVNECPLTKEQIQQLEEQGIGDRREDGFGRIVVNWLEEGEFIPSRPDKPQVSQSPLAPASRILAEKMAKRIIQEKLEQKLVDKVGRIKIEGSISNSQLSRLRLIARQALSNKDCDYVSNFLKNLPSNAKTQFSSATIGSKTLREQLDEWLNHPETWTSNKPTVTIAGTPYTVTPELDREYTLRLIMAVAKKATKERES